MHSDEFRLASIRNTLSPEYDIFDVKNSDAALGVLATQAVDVLLADGMLAGREFLDQVERMAPGVLPVVLADSSSINGLMNVLRDDSFCVSIDKSENPARILEHLRHLLFPRLAERLAVGNLAAEISVANYQTLNVPVFDISNRGFSFQFQWIDHLGHLLPGNRLELDLLQGGSEPIGSFAAIVRSVVPLTARPDGAGAKFKVGAEFLTGPHPEPEGATESISDPLRIAVLLGGALRRGGFIGHLADDEAPAVFFSSGDIDADIRTLALTPDANAQFSAGDVLQLSFSMGGRNFTFLGAVLGSEGGRTLLRFPRSVRASRRRENHRFTPGHGKPIEVEIITLTGERIRRTAIDVSAWGVALPISYRQEILPIGLVLHRVHLRFPDGTEVVSRGRVRSLVPTRHQRGELETPFKCGIQFEGLSLVEQVRIANAILGIGVESVHDAQGISFGDVWNLLEETGFLYPEKVERLKPLLPQIQQTLETVLNQPNRVFKTLVYRRDEKIQGHLSTLRAYRRTWLIQHLAARKNSEAQFAARMLNLGLAEYFDQIPQLEWFRIFFRVNNRWPARVFGTFARRMRDPTLSEMRRFNYMVASASGSFADAKHQIRPANAHDLSQIEAYFVERRRLVSLDADDLYGAVLPLTEVSREYAQLGLQREREIYVVADSCQEVMGFMLLEISSPGLNLSELTNTVQVYSRDGNSDIKRALMHFARRRYHKAGRQSCIALADDGDVTDFENAGFTKTKEYNCWTSHRTLLHKYQEHIIRMSRQERPRNEAAAW